MGMLIDGKWTDRRPAEVAGRFDWSRPHNRARLCRALSAA